MPQLTKILYLFSTICCILGISQHTIAQQIRISGKVVDAETSQPIPFTHVSIYDHTQGTVCNVKGDFNLVLPADFDGKVSISSIGYEIYHLALDARSLPYTIRLKSSKQLLSEVVISADAARQIVQKALEKIPDNYPTIPTNYEGFYRQALRSPKYDYLYISEASLKVHKKSYAAKQTFGQVKLLKARKVDFHLDTLNRIKFYAGPHTPHIRDFVMAREKFISNLNQYEYQLQDMTMYQGSPVYIISFSQKKGLTLADEYQGKLYIDQESYAFVKAEYNIFSKSILGNELNSYFKWYKSQTLVNYKKTAGRWHLQNIWNSKLGYDKILKDSVRGTLEYVTTTIDTVNNEVIPYGKRLQLKDIFIHKINDFDSTYWDNFNTIVREKELSDAIKDQKLHDTSLNLDYSSPDTVVRKLSKRQKFIKIFTRLKLTYLFNYTSFRRSGVNTQLTYGTESFTTTNNSSNAIGFTSSVIYPFSSKIYGQLNYTTTDGANKIKSAALNALYEFKLFKNKRPLFIRSGLGVAYSSWRQKIGKTDDPSSFQPNNFKKTVDLYLQSTSIGLQSYLSVSLELSHRWELYVDVSYTLPLHETYSALARESKGLFRKTNTMSSSLSHIGFVVDGTPVNNLPVELKLRSIGFGVLINLGN